MRGRLPENGSGYRLDSRERVNDAVVDGSRRGRI
jgi:hypothetical protein